MNLEWYLGPCPFMRNNANLMVSVVFLAWVEALCSSSQYVCLLTAVPLYVTFPPKEDWEIQTCLDFFFISTTIVFIFVFHYRLVTHSVSFFFFPVTEGIWHPGLSSVPCSFTRTALFDCFLKEQAQFIHQRHALQYQEETTPVEYLHHHVLRHQDHDQYMFKIYSVNTFIFSYLKLLKLHTLIGTTWCFKIWIHYIIFK